jgi:hypothetical protein
MSSMLPARYAVVKELRCSQQNGLLLLGYTGLLIP